MFGIALNELLLLFLLLLLWYGAMRLPSLGRSLGDAIRESRQSSKPQTTTDER